MFRMSYVHHQEDYLIPAALSVMFVASLFKQSSRLEDLLRAQPLCCRSPLSLGVRSGAVADLLLGLPVRIPPVAWVSVC